MQFRLRPVLNEKLGQWKICHNLWCERGETSVVAIILTSENEERDAAIAKLICDHFNDGEERNGR